MPTCPVFTRAKIKVPFWDFSHFASQKVPAVVIRIMLVGVVTHYALLQSVCDLKAGQVNVQCSLILEFMLYEEFKIWP